MKEKQSPFEIRAVVEGFYGAYYTAPERNSLIRFLGSHGFNGYIYAPKNDRRHRNRWREPYTEKALSRFAETIRVARAAGVDFCYALSPAVSIRYSSEEDFRILWEKLSTLFKLGTRSFALLMDDMPPDLRDPVDGSRFHSPARAQAMLCNRLYERLMELDQSCALSMCPTEYYGSPPFGEYLYELGLLLLPAIDVFYTGPETCSREISAADARAFGEAIYRRPIIWDNYPVNDLQMHAEMHIGPLRGRDSQLAEQVKGYAAVPMLQAEASKIPLSTVGDYLRDPWNYEPEASWQRALDDVAGESAPFLRLLAENSLHSCLGTPETLTLERLAAAALAELERGQPVSCAAVQSLESYLICLDEACDHLKNAMDNLALRAELLPWIELLEYWAWTGLRGLNTLRALERGEPWQTDYRFMKEYAVAARDHHKRIAGRYLLPLAEYVTEPVREVEEANG